MRGAWPRSYEAPKLSGTGTEVAVEELVLAVESLTVERGAR
ncbi:hypothetical protein [Streptomyces avermitilis]